MEFPHLGLCGLPRSRFALLGGHLRRARLAALQPALPPERDGGRVLPAVLGRVDLLAGGDVDNQLCELVRVTRTLARAAASGTPKSLARGGRPLMSDGWRTGTAPAVDRTRPS